MKRETAKKEKSWAEREVELAIKHEKEGSIKETGSIENVLYEIECYRSALKAYKVLEKDECEGCSHESTQTILDRLLEGKPLTGIPDVPETWTKCTDGRYQCKRMSSVFKHVANDGTVTYRDIDNHYCIDINSRVTYHSGLVQTEIMDKMFPITFPYYPGQQMVVCCENYLTDHNHVDTMAVSYVIKPDGEKVKINRFFKECNGDWEEIDFIDYQIRKRLSVPLLEKDETKAKYCNIRQGE